MARVNSQGGFSLLEILAALALGAMMMVSLTAMVDTSLQDTKSQQVAKYHEQFTAAASRYINDNAVKLYNDASAGTQTINHGELTSKGYLPNGFATTNAYNQQPCVLVRRHAAPLGSPNALDALVVTETGTAIPPKDLSYIAANAGSGGGQIDLGLPAQSSLIAYGTGWKLDTPTLSGFTIASCSGVPADTGHLASALFYGGPSSINKDVLYRNPTLDPLLNQMNIPLGFTGGLTGAMKAVGDPCTSPGITLETGTGNILKCNMTTSPGQWENSASRFWKDPVADFGALAGVSPPPQNGEVHMTLDFGRAYMYQSGAWLPLAINQNGDFIMQNPGNIVVTNGNVSLPAGTLAANNINSTTDVTATNDLIARRDLQVTRDIFATRNITSSQGNIVAQVGDINAVTGDVNAQGNIVAKFALVGDSVSTSPKVAGAPCNYPGRNRSGGTVIYLAAGTIVTDANGVIMECRTGGAPPGLGGTFIYVDGTSTTPP